MSIKTLPASFPPKVIYNIDSNFQVAITIKSNPFQLELNTLFEIAMRKNRKRSFLFISKILGKHLAVNPYVSLLGGAALAAGYLKTVYNIDYSYLPEVVQTFANHHKARDVYKKVMDNPMTIPERTLMIGFAETATALGFSIFNCFAENVWYIHTTREFIPELDSIIRFEEEHSHAVAHRCYALDKELFAGDHPIVFADDEITTGKTVLNIIRAIQQKFPRREYAIVSFLDWRSEAEQEQFRLTELELGIKIRTFSLLSGAITVAGKPSPEDQGLEVLANGVSIHSAMNAPVKVLRFGSEMMTEIIQLPSLDSTGKENRAPYLYATGRFGIPSDQREEVEELARQIGERLQAIRQGSRVLCLGTGEFMYLPMRIASYLGEGVVYHSTTRSPIRTVTRPDYLIQNRLSFPSPDDPEIINYLYNIPKDFYDELYIFLERDWPEERIQPLQEILGHLGIPRVYIVICGRGIYEKTKTNRQLQPR